MTKSTINLSGGQSVSAHLMVGRLHVRRDWIAWSLDAWPDAVEALVDPALRHALGRFEFVAPRPSHGPLAAALADTDDLIIDAFRAHARVRDDGQVWSVRLWTGGFQSMNAVLANAAGAELSHPFSPARGARLRPGDDYESAEAYETAQTMAVQVPALFTALNDGVEALTRGFEGWEDATFNEASSAG